jgi:site-specific DNA-cytosine methylase
MTKYKDWDIDRNAVDLIVGGTPCQSFSVAGLRKGLEDPRGNLALTFLGMVDHYRPEWVIWENVPGVLSSSGGRDFGSFLGALGQLGYGFAYRVLDAQYFGVPQRRRRVFVVAHSSGDSRRAAEVLFEPESLRGDSTKGRKTGQDTAQCLATGTGCRYDPNTETLIPVMYENHPNDSRITGPVDPSPTVAARWGTGGGNTPLVQHTYRKSRRAKSAEDFETWVPDEVTNTLNCFDLGDIRSVDIVVESFAQNQLGELRTSPIASTLGTNSNASGRNTPMVLQGAIPIQDVRGIEKKQNGIGIGKDGDPSYTIDSLATQGVAHTFKIRGQGHYTGTNGGTAKPGGGGSGLHGSR